MSENEPKRKWQSLSIIIYLNKRKKENVLEYLELYNNNNNNTKIFNLKYMWLYIGMFAKHVILLIIKYFLYGGESIVKMLSHIFSVVVRYI